MRTWRVRLPAASTAVSVTRTLTRAWRLSWRLTMRRVRAEIGSLIFVRTPGRSVILAEAVRSERAIWSAAMRPDAVTVQGSLHFAYT
jgi:hypothetical protein